MTRLPSLSMASLDRGRVATSYERTGTDFRVLGPLAVRYQGRPVPIPASKPQALLASLLLRANEPVLADRLIELLWYHQPPARARNTLQNHMRSEEHTSELQSQSNLVCRLLLEKKK